MFFPLLLSKLRPARPLALWTASLSLALTSCSVLPDAPAPAPPKASATTNIELPEVVIIGMPTTPVFDPISISPGGGGGGGGGDTPTGGGGGGGGGGSGSANGWTPAALDAAKILNGGNYGATLRMRSGQYSTIEVRVELNTKTHELTHLDLALSGITKFQSLEQKGEGVLTRYDPASDSYFFNVGLVLSYVDGTANNGIKTLEGWISPSGNVGGIKITP